MLVGARLRRLRTDLGLTRDQAGQAIRASEWKIHRLENGQVGFKDRDIIDLLAPLRASATRPRSPSSSRWPSQANAPGWWHQYNDIVPDWFRTLPRPGAGQLGHPYLRMPHLIPGLLQTEDCARAVIEVGHPDAPKPEEVERRVGLRMGRQRVLTQPHPPPFWAVVDEAALRRPVGGPDVMRPQIPSRLWSRFRAAQRHSPVMPFGRWCSPRPGGLQHLRFSARAPDMVYLKQLTSALYLDKRDDVDQYLVAMETPVHRGRPTQSRPKRSCGRSLVELTE